MSIPAWETHMGIMSSGTASHPTVTEYRNSPYISPDSSETTKSQMSKMALAFDTQAHHQDDISHDTLMGLQELDSHLAIFEGSSTPAKGSSTSGALSDIISDDIHISVDVPSNHHINDTRRQDTIVITDNASLLSMNGRVKAVKVSDGLSKYAIPAFHN
jgi:hypothetical protein